MTVTPSPVAWPYDGRGGIEILVPRCFTQSQEHAAPHLQLARLRTGRCSPSVHPLRPAARPHPSQAVSLPASVRPPTPWLLAKPCSHRRWSYDNASSSLSHRRRPAPARVEVRGGHPIVAVEVPPDIARVHTLSWQSGQSVAALRASRRADQSSDDISVSLAGLPSHRRVWARSSM